MTEQAAQDRPGCPAASVQMPDTLHIDLPHVDPVDVCLNINKYLIHMSTQQWELMGEGFVTSAMMTVLANSCMDIIQTFAEGILDAVMPQVYRYMRTYGTFSPAVLDLTEDRIHTYLGDSIEQALIDFLKIEVNQQNLAATTVFSHLLLRHITKTVNSVLAMSTQTPILVSRVPVFFVSGCVTSIIDLRDMVSQIITILTAALQAQHPAQTMTAAEGSWRALCEPSREELSFMFCINSRRELKQLVKAYIIRIVKVLKNRAQMPHCQMSSRNHRDICIRVGTDTHILTLEDSESHRQESSYCGLDAIPGAVPDSDNGESHSESCPFSSVTVIGATEGHSRRVGPSERESIKNLAEELVQAFYDEDLQGVRGETEVVDSVKFRELTDRLFHEVMGGRDYQIPFVPAGTRMCNTMTYRDLRRGVADPGIAVHALYMRTEELVARCAVQVLLWTLLRSEGSDSPSLLTADEVSDNLDFMLVPRNAGGDYVEGVFRSPYYIQNSSVLHQDVNDLIAEPLELTRSQFLGCIVHTSLMTLLVGEMLTSIGIRNAELIFEVVRKAVKQLQDVKPQLCDHFHASMMGRSYKDISQTAIADLLLEFGSVQEMQEFVRSGDPSFEEAFLRALRKRLRIPTSPVPPGNTAKKTTCGFFKTLKRLCCKKTWKKAGKATTVISLTSDQDDSELERKELIKGLACHRAAGYGNLT